jgi:hypothetical protein
MTKKSRRNVLRSECAMMMMMIQRASRESRNRLRKGLALMNKATESRNRLQRGLALTITVMMNKATESRNHLRRGLALTIVVTMNKATEITRPSAEMAAQITQPTGMMTNTMHSCRRILVFPPNYNHDRFIWLIMPTNYARKQTKF